MSKAADLCVMWTNHYTKEQVWPPLLERLPIMMDPANPFRNVMAPEDFDPSQMAKLASTTHFFW
eukprot:GDKH01014833.1.p2 GENE.GDKH01014833.1~~GDKH01014833.1.p2  ORF type:complete len:64 (+),score=10.60 GDKH01014833.1:2-193(+)